eukprot:TRINITY_DN549_c0_g1_i1.p1 TRINITY_DN549_c0_g1~~TRINITY_DN549_c0_g1_i1.p1  ORF type:complete len:318 (+),score=38.03 TRINITY_DN549_c0_g1_i1:72-956(+)
MADTTTLRRLRRLTSHVEPASMEPKQGDEQGDGLSLSFCSSSNVETTGTGFPVTGRPALHHQRRDSRALFARPSTNDDGPRFGRPVSESANEGQFESPPSASVGGGRRDARTLFARPSSKGGARFARPAGTAEKDAPLETKPHFAFASSESGRVPSSSSPQFARPSFDKTDGGVALAPRAQLLETVGAYLVQVELPGVQPDSIRVEVLPGDRRLVVQAERIVVPPGGGLRDPTGARDSHKRVVKQHKRRSSSRATYHLELDLPGELSMQREATAQLVNGLLQINLPKQAAAAAA